MPIRSFINLSFEEKNSALDDYSSITGKHPFLLEKDIWIVWILDCLFRAPFGYNLVFKGGTSLSKAYGAIDRFSEDIDLTYDIRAIAKDLIEETGVIPKTRSQAKRWTKEIDRRLAEWISEVVVPYLSIELNNQQFDIEVSHEGTVAKLKYNPSTQIQTDYIKPEISLEFGARSTGEPSHLLKITCDADSRSPGNDGWLPTAMARVMTAERTFWEKATAIHIVCLGGKIRGRGHFARHYYDLMRLEKTGYAEKALNDRDLAQTVAEHKSKFYMERDGKGNWIDYRKALNGSLRLVPTGEIRELINNDYDQMVDAGMLYSDVPTFNALIDQLAEIEKRANSI